jgi:hypothetical protein
MSPGSVAGLAAALSVVGWCSRALAEEGSKPKPSPVRLARVVFEPREEDAVLESEPADDDPTTTWERACEGPCDKLLPAGRRFRVAGPDYFPSRPFVLPELREKVVIEAEMKSSSVATPRALRIFGGSLFSLGSLYFVIGVPGLLNDGYPEMLAAGAVTMTVGAVLAGTGVIMLLSRGEAQESKARAAKVRTSNVAFDGARILF